MNGCPEGYNIMGLYGHNVLGASFHGPFGNYDADRDDLFRGIPGHENYG
jgi:hypothetical protein